jgi:hypothetical protein
MIWDVGETVIENSELPVLPGPPPTTSRLGDIVQPAAASIRAVASHLKRVRKACSSLVLRIAGTPPSIRLWILNWIAFALPVFAGLGQKRQLLRYARQDKTEE